MLCITQFITHSESFFLPSNNIKIRFAELTFKEEYLLKKSKVRQQQKTNCCLLYATLDLAIRTLQGIVFSNLSASTDILAIFRVMLKSWFYGSSLFLDLPHFHGSPCVWETTQRGNTVSLKYTLRSMNKKHETRSLDPYAPYSSLVIGSSVWAWRSHGWLFFSHGVHEIWLSQVLSLKITLTYSLWWSRHR